jgi:hypothetical protein
VLGDIPPPRYSVCNAGVHCVLRSVTLVGKVARSLDASSEAASPWRGNTPFALYSLALYVSQDALMARRCLHLSRQITMKFTDFPHPRVAVEPSDITWAGTID